MTANIIKFALSLLVLLAMSDTHAAAQEANAVAVEGYVFDQKTAKPLANVSVALVQGGVDGIIRGQGVTTNTHGFYAITVVPPVASITNDVNVLCGTKKGTVQTSVPLYVPMQTDRVYQRNFYLTLPKNVTGCH